MCGIGRRVPTSSRAIRSIGRCVADSPTRTGARPVVCSTSRSSRSSDSARCAPRLSPAIAWISSTITVRELRRAPRGRSRVVSRMNSDSGVVTRMCGGLLRHLRALAGRRVAGADARRGSRETSTPSRGRARAQLGERRLEVALDVVRQRLERRDVEDRACDRAAARSRPRRTRSSRHDRNAASVLPRAGRRRDQHVLARGDPRPTLALRRGRSAEAIAEPSGDERMKHAACQITAAPTKNDPPGSLLVHAAVQPV